VADLAQLADVVGAHAQRHPARRAEQIAEHRNCVAGRVIEQQSWPAGPQRAVADLGHLQIRRNRHRNTL
jgi:hypothetical protein